MEALVVTAWNVLLVVVGFGFVIFLHELGHFIAARWAGIRVHTFALGFGPGLVSWRKGLGFRLGSSEAEVNALIKDARQAADDSTPGNRDAATVLVNRAKRISPTEYRLNVLPVGGYVRMLGQEDANPGALSDAPDSYSSKPVWKRMIVVSAGVIMNIILAAVIFVGVFLYGIAEPPALAGVVRTGSPAAAAGMRMGDVITSINGRRPSTFMDLQVAAALSGPDDVLRIEVARADGTTGAFKITPQADAISRIRSIGVEPALGATIIDPPASIPTAHADLLSFIDRAGLTGVRPGMRITTINGEEIPARTVWRDQKVSSIDSLISVAEAGGGDPIALTFADGEGEVAIDLHPRPDFQTGSVRVGEIDRAVSHLLGLTPVMAVELVQSGSGGESVGMKTGDILAKIGSRAWPSIGEGIDEIQAARGKTIDLIVVRDGAMVPITAPVDAAGRIGFYPGSAWSTPIVAQTPDFVGESGASLAAERMNFSLIPGTRIDSIAGTPVADWSDIRAALRAATHSALAAEEGATVDLGITILDAGSFTEGHAEQTSITLGAADVAALHALSWNVDPVLDTMEFAMFPYKASTPVDALMMGASKTNQYMLMTYVTLQRLFQNTVKVEHLKGPVGIAHVGSQVAERGFIYLLFFLGVISINLAVVNFLPLPIVDGGLFLMLVYEAIVRKPVPLIVQNALTVVGLVLIGSMFLVVTFNDITGLFK